MASTKKKSASSKATAPVASPPPQSQPTADAPPKTRTERRAEQFQQRRLDRKKAPEKQKRDKLLMRGFFVGIAAILVGGLAYGIIDYAMSRDDNRKPEGVVSYQYTGGNHTEDPVEYTESPPVGGLHSSVWQNCGYYDGKIGNEHAVHSLEHGAVWVTYGPNTSDADKQRLEEMADDRNYLLVSQYDDQESPFVASAWNNQLPIESLDQKELTQFINSYMQGPQTPERGAICTNGTDEIVG